MVSTERTAREWFEEAARCYLECHQGCAWCGGAHRVFKLCRGEVVEFYCNVCDFRVGYDPQTGSHFSVPGRAKGGPTSETMHQF
jgi:hypothetical protein